MSFVTFMAFSLPQSIVMTLVAWAVIGILWLPKGKFFKSILDSFKCFGKKNKEKTPDGLQIMMKEKYEKLGPLT